MIRLIAFLFSFIPALGFADTFPALYQVSGVASDDALNVRSEANSEATIVSTLSANAHDVEVVVVSRDGSWGQVNVGETAGWVSMKFLTPQDLDPNDAFAREMTCFGTEPFWTLKISEGVQAEFSGQDIQPEVFPAGEFIRGRGRLDRHMIDFGSNGVAAIRNQICSDGMSDRVFGLDIDFLRTDSTLFSGCCSLLTD